MEFGFFILIFYLTLFVRIFCLVTNARERTHNVGLPTICLSCVLSKETPLPSAWKEKNDTNYTTKYSSDNFGPICKGSEDNNVDGIGPCRNLVLMNELKLVKPKAILDLTAEL